MNGVLWGLLGATLIGGSDVIARVTARQVSLSVLLLAVMGLSAIAMTAQMAFTGQWPVWHAAAWIQSAASGMLNLLALFFLYRALARGPVSVASPAASSFAVILVVLNVMAGEPFAWLQVPAVLLVFLGIIMLARRENNSAIDAAYDAHWLRTTALLGLGAAASIALRMFLAQEAAAQLGAIPALYLNRLFALTGVIVMLVWQISRSQALHWPKGKLVWLVAMQSLLETLALAAFLFGSAGSGRVSAAIGFSAFAAISAIIARIWLGELIGRRRSLWMSVVAAGIIVAVIAAP